MFQPNGGDNKILFKGPLLKIDAPDAYRLDLHNETRLKQHVNSNMVLYFI